MFKTILRVCMQCRKEKKDKTCSIMESPAGRAAVIRVAMCEGTQK